MKRSAGLGDGGIDRPAGGQRLVETLREFQRGSVGDLELHRDHGRDALQDEALSGPAEGIDRADVHPAARIENDQA
jgi:hypothetical protein